MSEYQQPENQPATQEEDLQYAYQVLKKRHQQAVAAAELERTADIGTNYDAQKRYRIAAQERILALIALRDFQDAHPSLFLPSTNQDNV